MNSISSNREPELVGLAALISVALAEDLGTTPTPDGDVTAAATVPADAQVTADFRVRQSGVVACIEAIAETYAQLDTNVEILHVVPNGTRVEAGDTIASVRGPARSVLVGERTALNLLTHLSGIASDTRRIVDAVAHTNCVVRDTRKTLPGLRGVQKAAVRAGGGQNHRFSLVDELLVKDNHVAAAGSFQAAVTGALHGAQGLPVEIEVDTLDELDIALAAGATRVMLDNFSLEDTSEGVRRCRSQAYDVFVEASGGITEATAPAIAATGVDAIAIGGLTHSAMALDIGLDIDWENGQL